MQTKLPNLNNYSAIIFDMDGTIADTEQMHFNAYQKTLNSLSETKVLNIKLDYSTAVEEFGGRGSDFFFKNLFQKYNITDPQTLKTAIQQKELEFIKLVNQQGVNFIPGFPQFLNQIQEKKTPYALASGSSLQIIELILNSLNLLNQFPLRFSSKGLCEPKPSPKLFQITAKHLGLKNPNSILVIEDSKFGVQAAKSANMPCLALLTTTSKKTLKSSGANWIIENYYPLISI